MSETIQSIAQNNYILQAPPPTATMFTTELEYDGDKISGYAGSAFKAGTDLEFGYTDADTISSINNSALTDVGLNNIVQTNSGVWGGSALPISAGPGIDIRLSNDILVFSAVPDETVLWSGYYTPSNGTNITFTEPASSFNEIKFVAQGHDSFIPEEHVFEFSATPARTIPLIFNGMPGQGGIRINSCLGTFSSNYMRLDISLCRQHSLEGASTTVVTAANNARITKVIGINRKQ